VAKVPEDVFTGASGLNDIVDALTVPALTATQIRPVVDVFERAVLSAIVPKSH